MGLLRFGFECTLARSKIFNNVINVMKTWTEMMGKLVTTFDAVVQQVQRHDEALTELFNVQSRILQILQDKGSNMVIKLGDLKKEVKPN